MKKVTMSLLCALTVLPLMAQLPSANPEITFPGSSLNIVSKTGQSYQYAAPRPSRIQTSGIGAGQAQSIEKSNIPEGERTYYTITDDLIYEDQSSVL